MASRGRLVMLEGHIEGMGRKEECSVMAMKVSLHGSELYEYAKASIHRAPKDLPDGQYTVMFDGRKDRVNLMDGRWYASDNAL